MFDLAFAYVFPFSVQYVEIVPSTEHFMRMPPEQAAKVVATSTRRTAATGVEVEFTVATGTLLLTYHDSAHLMCSSEQT